MPAAAQNAPFYFHRQLTIDPGEIKPPATVWMKYMFRLGGGQFHGFHVHLKLSFQPAGAFGQGCFGFGFGAGGRSEEQPSELQSLMRISYAVLCLKKNNKQN